MLDEFRYLLGVPWAGLRVAGVSLSRALRDLARPLARVLLLLIPALLISLWLPAQIGPLLRLIVLALAALVLVGELVLRFVWHLRVSEGYSYGRPRS